MPSISSRPSRSTFWIAIITLLSGLLGLGTLFTAPPWKLDLHIPQDNHHNRYTYEGSDYPDTWPIPPLEKVYMSVENTVHYAFDTSQGRAEWENATLPPGGALVYLGPAYRPFTLGMFHNIRCLGIIREFLDDLYGENRFQEDGRRREIANHCMNNLRQMVLCSADMRLETVRAGVGRAIAVSEVTHTCLDWEAVYLAAEENFRKFREYQGRNGTGDV